MIAIPKPEHRMKTVIIQLEKCIYFNDCRRCWYRCDKFCQEKLMADGLYYLKMALEKSEGKKER